MVWIFNVRLEAILNGDLWCLSKTVYQLNGHFLEWWIIHMCGRWMSPQATPTPDVQYDVKRTLIYTGTSPLYCSHHSFPQRQGWRPLHQGTSSQDLDREQRELFQTLPNKAKAPSPLPSPPTHLYQASLCFFSEWKQLRAPSCVEHWTHWRGITINDKKGIQNMFETKAKAALVQCGIVRYLNVLNNKIVFLSQINSLNVL